MNNNLVDFFGVFSLELVYILLGLAAACLLILIILVVELVKISKLKRKYQQFMEGSDGKSIETLIKKNLSDISRLQQVSSKNSDAIEDIYNKIQYSFQKVGIVKYDAFHEMGGKLSFAICMLDKLDNGCLVNVMHSNTGCFAYVKEIVNGKSFIELGDEEKKALDQALAGKMGDSNMSKKINDLLEPENVNVSAAKFD